MDRDIRRALARKYNGMKQRCYNPKNSEYKNYGARGIGICEEWLSNPDSFFEWGVLNGYEKGLTIDRIDVNRGYEPENCRWATMAEQQSNKRSNVMVECNGEMVTLAEASRRIGISESAVWMRIKREIQVDMEPYKWEKPVIRDAGAIFHSVKEAAKEVYSLEEWQESGYGAGDVCKVDEPVQMCIGFCKKYKKYDTVLVPLDQYVKYCECACLPLDKPKGG